MSDMDIDETLLREDERAALHSERIPASPFERLLLSRLAAERAEKAAAQRERDEWHQRWLTLDEKLAPLRAQAELPEVTEESTECPECGRLFGLLACTATAGIVPDAIRRTLPRSPRST